MKKIYILAIALIMSVSITTGAHAESNRGLGLSNSLEINSQLNAGVRTGDNDRDDNDEMRESDRWNIGDHNPRIVGTVTAISGTTLTLTSNNLSNNTSTTYSIDASNAKVEMNGSVSSTSNIKVGDMIWVEGTISGTNVVATEIKDQKHNDKKPDFMQGLQSNGQPIIGGKVTVVSGSMITITNKSNIAYTVDVTNAKITKNGSTSTASNIAVGDTILAQGTITGTSVVAVSVVDQGTMSNPNGNNGKHKGFFKRIGIWFSHIFGF